ncbi:hypothetical protein HX004_12215 [Myroides sp. 1354]|uniref:hypothetical protein n=1 Tax=Myroides TaxID=76831 RepID=UPI00131CD94F|nr:MULTISPECIES: hypothetical protein [Myroides]MDM1045536.1 hypothetical protein [Myroides sp. R163-1]MDM1056538.1 hypothetical protein [Myroides sp. 1354]MDM1069592.1 hypothetical protein [Myroides sp. 1372]
MKKIVLVLSLFALSTTSFANCFPVYFSCGGGTTYCAEENSSFDQIQEDVEYVDHYVCG